MVIQFFDAATDGYRLAGIMGAWVCEPTGRVFILSYATDAVEGSQDLMTVLERHLESFACHEIP
jgi:hypothetical protein